MLPIGSLRADFHGYLSEKLSLNRPQVAIHRDWPSNRHSASRFYDFKLRPTALRGCWRGCFKGYAGNVVLTPDSSANVDCLEAVQAKLELIRQLFGFKSKFDTDASTREIVNGAMVNDRAVNQDPSRVVSFGAPRSPFFHMLVRSLG
jgi:hypothetical protein